MKPQIHFSRVFPTVMKIECEVCPKGGEHLHCVADCLLLGLLQVCSLHSYHRVWLQQNGEHSNLRNRSTNNWFMKVAFFVKKKDDIYAAGREILLLLFNLNCMNCYVHKIPVFGPLRSSF
jgi:hypothetical protein